MHHPSLTPGPDERSIKAFFEVGCASLLKVGAPVLPSGTCRFRVRGKGGGTWTLDFDKGRVTHDDVAFATAEVDAGADDLQALLDGRLPPEEALRHGRMEVRGDPQVLRAIARVFAGVAP